MAEQDGKYLLKLWTGSIPNEYQLTVSGPRVEQIEQLIWSPAVSNKDGSLFEKGPEVHRNHSSSQFDDTGGRDRGHQSFR